MFQRGACRRQSFQADVNGLHGVLQLAARSTKSGKVGDDGDAPDDQTNDPSVDEAVERNVIQVKYNCADQKKENKRQDDTAFLP